LSFLWLIFFYSYFSGPPNGGGGNPSPLGWVPTGPPWVLKRSMPTVFNCSEIRIRNTLDFLNSVGLDGVRIVNAYPSVLCFCVDTKLRPVVHFVTIVMGRDVRALQKNPACLGFSLHGRLIPRYQFAILHHKQHLSLGTLFNTADERFVNSLPQSLGAYRDFVAEYRRE